MSTDSDSSRSRSHLFALGKGIYTVPETCRILGRGMTARKIHYWLNQDLLGKPIRRGSRGVPTFLSFEQVLRVKTLQRIRDELDFSLLRARSALQWIVDNLVADEEHWQELHFFRSRRTIGVGLPDGSGFLEIGSGQSVLPVTDELLAYLSQYLQDMRAAWETRTLSIEGYPKLCSSALIMAGSPVILDTRIETAFIANLAQEMSSRQIHEEIFPDIEIAAIDEAAEFERAA